MTTSSQSLAVTADLALFSLREEAPVVVLVERANEPFKGSWAIPGGFVEIDEDLPAAAAREMREETGIRLSTPLTQLGAYGAPGRDPRMRVVTVVFVAVAADIPDPVGGDDAARAEIVPVDQALASPGRLAFDHHLILGDAWDEWGPVVQKML